MIEPTDEMIIAWRNAMKAAAAEAVKAGAPLGRSQEIARAGLAAVLAIVERDYAVERRPAVGLCCIGYGGCERLPGCAALDRESKP